MTMPDQLAQPGPEAEQTVLDVLTPPTTPGVFSFGPAEIMLMCGMSDTEGAKRTLEALRFDPELFTEPVRLGALATLMARGFLTIDAEGRPAPAYAASAIVYAAANATAWVSMSFLGQEEGDNAFLIRGGELTIVMQRRMYGVHHVMIADEEGGLVETLWGLMDAQFDESPDSTVGLIVEREGQDESTVLFVRQSADESGKALEGKFDVAMGKGTDEKPEILPDGPRDEQGLDELLERVLGEGDGAGA